jgi:hypothetical protein
VTVLPTSSEDTPVLGSRAEAPGLNGDTGTSPVSGAFCCDEFPDGWYDFLGKPGQLSGFTVEV